MHITKVTAPTTSSLAILLLQANIRHKPYYVATDAEGHTGLGDTPQLAIAEARAWYKRSHGNPRHKATDLFLD